LSHETTSFPLHLWLVSMNSMIPPQSSNSCFRYGRNASSHCIASEQSQYHMQQEPT
jgi:hypothetical protein